MSASEWAVSGWLPPKKAKRLDSDFAGAPLADFSSPDSAIAKGGP
jgi:hypothetical protein